MGAGHMRTLEVLNGRLVFRFFLYVIAPILFALSVSLFAPLLQTTLKQTEAKYRVILHSSALYSQSYW
jgi:hypothetical protein